jgi:LEA14-like dessication related protein
MLFSRRRIILIGVIAAVVVTIVLLPLILTITLPTDVSDVTIKLEKVEVVKNATAVNPRIVQLNLVFGVHNPTDKSLTTSRIEYQLYANGRPLGDGILSYEDVPVNGRPQLLSKTDTQLQSQFTITPSNSNSEILRQITNQSTGRNITWKVIGNADIDSGFSSASKSFNNGI